MTEAAGARICAEFSISSRESFVASISERPGRGRVGAISRVKHGAHGERRLAVFEFGAHRLLAISSLIDELMRALVALEQAAKD